MGRPDDADAFLDAAERQTQRSGTPLARRITARALRAVVEARRGRHDRALAALTVATGLAGSEPFARTLLDEGEELRGLAAELSAAAGADAPIRRRLAAAPRSRGARGA